jgi:hypothetical protein
MLKITNLSADAHQQTTVLLEDKTAVGMTLYFRPSTQRWTIDIVYGIFSIKGLSLCNHFNLLRSFRQVIPFGLVCQSIDGVDPFDINDFDSQRVSLYVLDNTAQNTEVVDIEVSGGIN